MIMYCISASAVPRVVSLHGSRCAHSRNVYVSRFRVSASNLCIISVSKIFTLTRSCYLSLSPRSADTSVDSCQRTQQLLRLFKFNFNVIRLIRRIFLIYSNGRFINFVAVGSCSGSRSLNAVANCIIAHVSWSVQQLVIRC